MNRKDFLKLCGILGISAPFQSVLLGCDNSDAMGSDFSGSVIIIGAGAAGMAAGYLLAQQGDVAPSRISRVLSRSIDQKVFFAGDAYTQEDDWGAVHNAARSARDAVRELAV